MSISYIKQIFNPELQVKGVEGVKHFAVDNVDDVDGHKALGYIKLNATRMRRFSVFRISGRERKNLFTLFQMKC
jgi:hypothetical protein